MYTQWKNFSEALSYHSQKQNKSVYTWEKELLVLTKPEMDKDTTVFPSVNVWRVKKFKGCRTAPTLWPWDISFFCKMIQVSKIKKAFKQYSDKT